MTNPSDPNYKKNVGRLVTDRYDFESHLNGSNFRHKAKNTALDVQSAIEKIGTFISSPGIVDGATTTAPGTIQLVGDLKNNGIDPAYPIKVKGIQGFPVSTLPPSAYDVLMFNGLEYVPSASPFSFSAGGDLDGTNLSQQVIKITGDSGSVEVLADNIIFKNTTTPVIKQNDTSSTTKDFKISAQSCTTSFKGGDLILSGGDGGTGYSDGGVSLRLGTSTNLVQLSEIEPERRVLSLLRESGITSTQMPSGTGDLVAYIGDTTTPPISNPVDGSILYSYDGKLNVRNSNGDTFELGSIPNPSIWGPVGSQTYTKRIFQSISPDSSLTLFSYDMEINTTYKVDVSFVIKFASDGYAYSYTANKTMSFTVINDGTIYDLGIESEYDKRGYPPSFMSGTPSFLPVITSSSPPDKKILITADNNSGDATIHYMVVVQIISCCASGDWEPSIIVP